MLENYCQDSSKRELGAEGRASGRPTRAQAAGPSARAQPAQARRDAGTGAAEKAGALMVIACPQCGLPTTRALCRPCCDAIARANQIADWDAIPACERGDTQRQLTDAVIETMRAMELEQKE